MQLTPATLATPLLLTPAEAAERCRVSRAHVYRAIQSGELEAVRVGPTGPLRIDVEALEAWLYVTTEHFRATPSRGSRDNPATAVLLSGRRGGLGPRAAR